MSPISLQSPSTRFKTVLITGTTSGLGEAFKKYYLNQGAFVINVNRRADSPSTFVLDITSDRQVLSFLTDLVKSEKVPDLFILNAGINRVDNMDGLDFEEFSKVMQVNLFGVLTFISAIKKLGLKNKTIATLSSTSNIIP